MPTELLERRLAAAKFERKRLKRLIKHIKEQLKTDETPEPTTHFSHRLPEG